MREEVRGDRVALLVQAPGTTMTFNDRVQALAQYSFTPRQAAFLTTVMLHSGVCLPRQYTKFAGIVFGHTTRDFFARLTREKFATAHAYWSRQGTYFHVHHKGVVWSRHGRE